MQSFLIVQQVGKYNFIAIANLKRSIELVQVLHLFIESSLWDLICWAWWLQLIGAIV